MHYYIRNVKTYFLLRLKSDQNIPPNPDSINESIKLNAVSFFFDLNDQSSYTPEKHMTDQAKNGTKCVHRFEQNLTLDNLFSSKYTDLS